MKQSATLFPSVRFRMRRVQKLIDEQEVARFTTQTNLKE